MAHQVKALPGGVPACVAGAVVLGACSVEPGAFTGLLVRSPDGALRAVYYDKPTGRLVAVKVDEG